MDILKVSGVRFVGVSACIPQNLVDNRDSCKHLFDNLDTLIKATGIKARCVADCGTTALDLEVCAARDLMAKTNAAPNEIGAVICVTFTPEYLMPADAPSAQKQLNIPNHSLAFDINMACSGYGYGLYVSSMLAKALSKKVLLLNGDVQSVYVSKYDKATVPVMADIGTATLIEPVTGGEDWDFSFYTDGGGRESLFIPAGGSKNPVGEEDLQYINYDEGSRRRAIDIYMNGFEIFRFVAMDVSRFLLEFMSICDINSNTIDAFVPHQANIYMIQQLAKKLKIPLEKLWKSGDIYGNPSSASIPLTIANCAGEWFALNRNMDGRIMASGFGGGLSISACNIILPCDAVYSVTNYKPYTP